LWRSDDACADHDGGGRANFCARVVSRDALEAQRVADILQLRRVCPLLAYLESVAEEGGVASARCVVSKEESKPNTGGSAPERRTSVHVSVLLLFDRKLLLLLCLKLTLSASSRPWSRPGRQTHMPSSSVGCQTRRRTPSPTLTAGARTVAVRPLTLRLPPGRYETLGAAVEGLERDRLQHCWRARVDAAEATLHSLSTAGAEPAAAEEEAVVRALVGGGGAVRAT
jgi:hypothetical protein